jgi:hypothetical protein
MNLGVVATKYVFRLRGGYRDLCSGHGCGEENADSVNNGSMPQQRRAKEMKRLDVIGEVELDVRKSIA